MPMISGTVNGNIHSPCAAPDRSALESYLRFSYPLGKNGLFGGNAAPYEKPRFHFEPEKEKDEYLGELICILNDILETEREYSEAAFLSSGVDSSLLAFGIRARKTFSAAYEDADFDESAAAEQAARELGSEHHTVRISPSDYLDAVDEALYYRGAPTGDASYIALFLTAKQAARHTDTICSGEGPDELFCGYPCYSRYFDDPREDFWLDVNSVMNVGDVPSLPDYDADGFLKMNAWDLTVWMRGNILPNVAAAAKGAGIAIRTPYMRNDLLDFALSLPVRYKADRNMGKLLFREAAQRYVGREIAFRQKRGFPVPVRRWMRLKQYREQIADALTGSLARETLFFIDTEPLLCRFYDAGDDSVWKQVWEVFTLIRWIGIGETL